MHGARVCAAFTRNYYVSSCVLCVRSVWSSVECLRVCTVHILCKTDCGDDICTRSQARACALQGDRLIIPAYDLTNVRARARSQVLHDDIRDRSDTRTHAIHLHTIRTGHVGHQCGLLRTICTDKYTSRLKVLHYVPIKRSQQTDSIVFCCRVI